MKAPAVFFALSALVFAALSIEAGLRGHWWQFAFSAFWFAMYFGAAVDLAWYEISRRPER